MRTSRRESASRPENSSSKSSSSVTLDESSGTSDAALISSRVAATSRKSLGDIEVKRLETLDLGEVLLGNLGDGNRADIDLLPAHKLKQKVKRSGIDLRRHAIRHAIPLSL